jgi:two-component system nitrate/nitrite response regulator NarP
MSATIARDNSPAQRRRWCLEHQTKVFIVDDHPILCEMVASMLGVDPAFEVVGMASSIRESLAAVERCGPDLILVDLTLQDGSGMELVRTLRSRGIEARVLVLTGVRSKDVVAEALSAGVVGYVLKEQSPADLRTAIDAVMGGGTYIAPGVADPHADSPTAEGHVGGNPVRKRAAG